jgi:hypothetical protein
MSSPVINNVILFGCVMGYVSIFLLGIKLPNIDDASVSAVCHSKLIVLMLSFTLAFGGLFAKVRMPRSGW